MALTKKEELERGRRPSSDVTPPEGGWGWMVVIACFLTTICTRAVTRCVSIFFVEFQLHFQTDYSSTAWIHSLTDSTTMLCAPLGSLLGNHMSCRATVMLGGLLSSAGLILSSFAPSIEFLYIFMGILTGLGFALSYTPSIAMVGTYFDERKALAYGIALSGSGIGTFILAPVVQMLIEHYSWRGALLILGGFVANLCVCGALMRPLEPSGGGQEKESLQENNVPNQERNGVKAVKEALDSKDTDCSGVEMEINKLNCTQGLTAKEVDSYSLVQRNRFFVSRLSDTKFRNIKCFLFHNELTANSGTLKQSDHELANGSTAEGLILNKKLADIMDTRDSGFTYTKSSEVPLLDKTADVVPKPTCSSRGCCSASKEEFSFLFVPNFLILSLSVLFMAYGCSSSVVYLVPYALSTQMEDKHAAFLMSIFGVCGIVGNITFGWLTDRKCLKRYRTFCYMIAVGMDGLCCMFIPFLHSFPLLALASVFYGYFDGAYVALIPVVTSEVLNSNYLTSALGVVYFLHGIPYLVSPPIGGWLVDRTGNYTATFLLSGASFIFSSVILAAAMLVRRFSKSRSKPAATSCPDSAQQGII